MTDMVGVELTSLPGWPAWRLICGWCGLRRHYRREADARVAAEGHWRGECRHLPDT